MAKDFTKEWNRAKNAARIAGEKWIAEHTQPMYAVKDGFSGRVVGTMLDVCGRCYVQTKMNTAFGRWTKKQDRQQGKWLHFRNELEYRQEMGLHEAMATAALKSLESDGIEGLTLYSWVD